LRRVKPILSLTIKGDREFLGKEIVNRSGLLCRDGFADTPQFVTQVFARVVIGEIRPQNTCQFFTAMGSPGCQRKISQ